MSFRTAFIIIVTGRPAAGKSTLANWLSKELKLPVVSKDSIREVLFEGLGWKDRTWAQKLTVVSIELMFHFAQLQLKSGHSIIMDNSFLPSLSTSRFTTLKKQTGAEIIQIVCDAHSELLFQRFKNRAETGERHPGHGDFDVLEKLQKGLNKNLPMLMELGGQVIEVDTTDFSTLKYEDVLEKVRTYVNKD